MVEYYQLPMPQRIPKSIIILFLFLIIAAALAILFFPFLIHGPAGSLIILVLAILGIIAYIIARRKGLEDTRSSKQKRVIILLCSGFASFFSYAALAVTLMGHPMHFPSNLPLLSAIILAAALTALIADVIARKASSY